VVTRLRKTSSVGRLLIFMGLTRENNSVNHGDTEALRESQQGSYGLDTLEDLNPSIQNCI